MIPGYVLNLVSVCAFLYIVTGLFAKNFKDVSGPVVGVLVLLSWYVLNVFLPFVGPDSPWEEAWLYLPYVWYFVISLVLFKYKFHKSWPVALVLGVTASVASFIGVVISGYL